MHRFNFAVPFISPLFAPLFAIALAVTSPALAEKTPVKTRPLPPSEAHNHANEVEMAVMGNTLVTLYHELAHGLVDIYGLPMLGREEDAADSFALVELITQIRSPETDEATDAALAAYARATALAWYHFARDDPDTSPGAYFGPHALDQQRMFQTVCLLTGAEPELFEDLPEQLGIGGFYLIGCERAFREAYDGWVYTLDTFGAFHKSDEGRQTVDLTFDFQPPEDEAHVRWARAAKEWPYLEEVQRHFSTSFQMETPIAVTFKSCGEENAFYFPGQARVTLCYDLMETYARFARRPIEPPPSSNESEESE